MNATGSRLYTPEIRKKAAEYGLVGAWVPEEYGGAGVGMLGNALIMEEFSKVDMGIALNVVAAGFGCESIFQYGTEEQKKAYLPASLLGREGLRRGIHGAQCRYRCGWIQDSSGQGWKRLHHQWQQDVHHQRVSLRLHGGPVHHKSGGKEAQQLQPHHCPRGCQRHLQKQDQRENGYSQLDTAEIAFEDVRVPLSNLVGTEGHGFKQLMHFFDTTRVMVAAQGLGLSEACLKASIQYAKERTAFGSPLGSFQLTQKKLAEMAIMIEALRGLVYKSAWLIDAGRPDYHLAAMAKFFSGQTAVFCANNALEIHGGYGYIEEYPVQKWYRDAKILEIYEGTKEAEIMTIGRVLQA